MQLTNFIREVRTEMGKVTWPTREELRGSTIVVIVAVIIMAVFIGSVDWGLSRLLQIFVR